MSGVTLAALRVLTIYLARIDDAGNATLADTSALAVARDQEVAGDHGENHDKEEYEKEG